MVFELQENDVIKKQNIEITETMMGIYGYNNSGKTTVLRELDKIIDKENWGCIVNEGQYIRSLFIPTNRVIVREAYTSSASVKDLEDFLAYKRDSYKEYDLHLRIIRADLLQNDAVRQIIKKAIKYMFGGDYEFDFSNRQSDGVENIINIYCNIIWLFTWDKDIENIKADELSQYLRSTSAVIMIDEIEAFLHVYVQSRMLQKFKDDFSKCSFVFTTHSPLLLSRYYDIRKFQLENGLLNEVNADLYYKDLDNIYEVYFNVDEFPGEARKIINRLGDYILGDEYDKDAVAKDLKILNEKYVNIKDKYPGLVAPAKFIHFGTTREILALMSGGVDDYKALGWCKKVNSSISGNTAGYNSVLSDRAVIGDGCYLEVSFVHSKAVIGNNVVLSYIDIHDELIPDNVVLHGLKQKNGKFVCRIYGVLDNPKENKLFGIDLEEVLHKLEIRPEDVWNSSEHLLWFAKIYPECDSIKEAVGAALNLFDLLQGEGNLDEWKNAQRKSLCAGFNDADASAIIAWNRRMQELVKMDEIAKDIRSGKPARETESLPPLTRLQGNWLEKRFKRADFSESVRLNYYIGTALGNRQGDKYIAESFRTISGQILKAALHNLQYNDSCRIVSDRHTVKLPLRVNWGGGWSDTPPICCEMGGTVLNAAISLNGELPVEVTLVRIPEKKIVFDSRDMDVHGEFDSIEELQKTGDPYDSFALQKACLLACGIIPSEGGKLDEILTRLGGGFEMHSEVTNVPKGSGLGTSSILSAACVKAVFEFMGIAYTEADLYAHVLVMEQIMSTGGGWQDQVGGVTNGIKYITSKPGLDQQIKVEHIELQPETKRELNERFCLIYTGQRRLARNLLRDVVGRYVGNEPDSLFALNEIQKVAALMRFELERGNIDEFAALLDYHWELSRKVDAGSTNTLIDQIFLSIEDLIDARMVCGAGGGGFLQVILKKGITKEDVHKRLKDVFQDNPVDVWDCEII